MMISRFWCVVLIVTLLDQFGFQRFQASSARDPQHNVQDADCGIHP